MDSLHALSVCVCVYMYVILVVGNWNVCSGGDHFGSEVGNEEVGVGSMDLEESVRASSNSMDEVNKKRLRNVYLEVLKSYDKLQFHKDHLKEAKNKMLRCRNL